MSGLKPGQRWLLNKLLGVKLIFIFKVLPTQTKKIRTLKKIKENFDLCYNFKGC